MLAYERVGRGEPLLLIHGISHRRQGWAPVLDRLAEHHEVIAIDLPGHGGSPRFEPGDRPVAAALTDEIEHLLVEIDQPRPHVVGNSLGGLIALEMALNGHARTVTALSPAGFWRGPADFAYIRGLFATVQASARVLEPVAPRLAQHRWGRALALGWATAHPTRVTPEAMLGDTRNMIASREAIRTIFGGAITYEGDGGDVPTTIAWGTRDTVLLPYQARRARTQLPAAEHVWLRGCGHVPMSDDPDLVARVILARTGATAPAGATA